MIPNRRRIDLSKYPRRALLEAFKDRELPCFSVTCNVEIGALRQRLALTGHRFFITMSWILSVAANRIPELRHRLIDGELYEFERVDPGYTVLLDDHTFSFCDSVHREDFDVYYADVECRIAAARADPDRSTGDKHHMIFITNVPWLSFTAVTHPFSAQYASIPILTLGKFFTQGAQVVLPLAVQVHHGLADGWHVGRFYDEVQRLVAETSFLRPNPGLPGRLRER